MANVYVITNTMRSSASGFFAGVSTWMGVGTGLSPATNADTTLGTEVTTSALAGTGVYTRASSVNTQATVNVANDSVTFTASWFNPAGSANSIAVTEFAQFTQLASPGGSMFFKATLNAALNLAPTFGITAASTATFG